MSKHHSSCQKCKSITLSVQYHERTSLLLCANCRQKVDLAIMFPEKSQARTFQPVNHRFDCGSHHVIGYQEIEMGNEREIDSRIQPDGKGGMIDIGPDQGGTPSQQKTSNRSFERAANIEADTPITVGGMRYIGGYIGPSLPLGPGDIGIHEGMQKLDDEISAERRAHIKKVSEPLLQATVDPGEFKSGDIVGSHHVIPPGFQSRPLRPDEMTDIRNHTGNKYLRVCYGAVDVAKSLLIDVYCVLWAFGVACPARQHAIKKLLCAGLRGKGSQVNDLIEARDSISRAIQLQQADELNAAEETKK